MIFWAFLFSLESSFLYFGGVFNNTIIPLALVGYEMIIANLALRALWLSIISNSTSAHGIIVNNSLMMHVINNMTTRCTPTEW